MLWLPEDVVAKIRQDFVEDEALLILEMLVDLRKEKPEWLGDRMLRCVVFLARGQFNKLANAIDGARIDWRDTIVAAEDETHCRNSCRARNFNIPFGLYPDIELLKSWMDGRWIPLPPIPPEKEGEKWTIKREEIEKFSFEGAKPLMEVITSETDPNVYFAAVDFLFVHGAPDPGSQRALEARVFFHYRILPDAAGFEFLNFKYRPEYLKITERWHRDLRFRALRSEWWSPRPLAW